MKLKKTHIGNIQAAIMAIVVLSSCGSGYLKSNTTFILPARDSGWQAFIDPLDREEGQNVWTGVQYNNTIVYNSKLNRNLISVRQVTRDSICVRK